MKTSFTVLVSSLLAFSLVGCAAVDNPAGSDTTKTASEAAPCVDTKTADNSESPATDEMASSEMSESTAEAAFRFHLLQEELPPAEGPEEEVMAFDMPADDGAESELSGDGSEVEPETTEASAEPEMAEASAEASSGAEKNPCPPAGGESGESGSSEGGEESQSELTPPEESMIGAEDDPTSEDQSELVAPEEGEETAA